MTFTTFTEIRDVGTRFPSFLLQDHFDDFMNELREQKGPPSVQLSCSKSKLGHIDQESGTSFTVNCYWDEKNHLEHNGKSLSDPGLKSENQVKNHHDDDNNDGDSERGKRKN